MKLPRGVALPLGTAALVLITAASIIATPWIDAAVDAMFGPAPVTGAARVIDGDTLEISGARIRLAGIDAPELSQTCADGRGGDTRCGRQVRAALAEFIGADVVVCRPFDRDRYGRLLAACAARGRDLGTWLVENGLATALDGPRGRDFRSAEERARAAGAGLWALGFERPSEWRRRQAN